ISAAESVGVHRDGIDLCCVERRTANIDPGHARPDWPGRIILESHPRDLRKAPVFFSRSAHAVLQELLYFGAADSNLNEVVFVRKYRKNVSSRYVAGTVGLVRPYAAAVDQSNVGSHRLAIDISKQIPKVAFA